MAITLKDIQRVQNRRNRLRDRAPRWTMVSNRRLGELCEVSKTTIHYVLNNKRSGYPIDREGILNKICSALDQIEQEVERELRLNRTVTAEPIQ